jgi:hypothetical protein
MHSCDFTSQSHLIYHITQHLSTHQKSSTPKRIWSNKLFFFSIPFSATVPRLSACGTSDKHKLRNLCSSSRYISIKNHITSSLIWRVTKQKKILWPIDFLSPLETPFYHKWCEKLHHSNKHQLKMFFSRKTTVFELTINLLGFQCI